MSFNSNIQPGTFLLLLGPLLVGITFIWAGFVKGVAPHVFSQHLSRLGNMPRLLLRYGAVAVAGFESAWGAALVLGVFPRTVLPVTAALLVGLTAISWWGVKSGRTTDCGCYGGYVVPSLAQSLALNAIFIALTLVPWIAGADAPTPTWKIMAAVVVGIAASALGAASQWFLATHGRFMIDMSPLKVGRAWSTRWGAGIQSDGRDQMVSYLGPDCPHCKQWVRVLNTMEQSPGLPRVVGVVAASKETLDAFVKSADIRFPVNTIPQTLMSRLVWGVPTTVLVSDGRIKDQWGGHMPPEFFARFRDAFFPPTASGQ
jgi:uncharacterized membrane protein YphA (DoxX/SURF4 family)